MDKKVKKELDGTKTMRLLDKSYFLEEAEKVNKLLLKDNASIKEYQALNGKIEMIERYDNTSKKMVAIKSAVLIKLSLKDRFNNEWLATIKASASQSGIKSNLISVVKTLDTRLQKESKKIDILSGFGIK